MESARVGQKGERGRRFLPIGGDRDDEMTSHSLLQDKISACTLTEAWQVADPARRRWRSLLGGIYCLEGTISAGKTTLGREMSQQLAQKGLGGWFGEEHVNSAMLKLFYDEMERIEKLRREAGGAVVGKRNRYAFSLQIAMLEACKSSYQAALEVTRGRAGIAVMDRTVFGNAVFAAMHADDGNLTPAEFGAYLSLMGEDRRAPYRTDRIVYVDAAPSVAHERRRLRGRQGEEAIPLAYFEKLEKAYYFQLHAQATQRTSRVIVVQNDRFVDAPRALDLLTDDDLPDLTRAFFVERMPDPARGPVSSEQIRLGMDALWREVTLPRMAGCSLELVSLHLPCRALPVTMTMTTTAATSAHNIDGDDGTVSETEGEDVGASRPLTAREVAPVAC
jgi:deoxyadenosine/deoxycytidine kinase